MAHRHTPASPAAFLTRLADQRRFWEPLVAFDPTARHYVQLAAERDVEAWLLTWLPSQGTEWHDHGGSAGAFLTVRGTLTERSAVVRRDQPPRILPGDRRLGPGALRTFGAKHLHRVTNDGVEPAVSLHAYAPALLEMNEYIADGDQLVRTESRLAGVSW